MKKVTFTFVGQDSDTMAQTFYTWFVDGGLEDQIVDTLSDMGPSTVELIEINNDSLDLIMGCSYKA
jgi:hypothetical protein